MRVTDALNAGSAGRLPWTEVVRRVEGTWGTVTLHGDFTPGDRFRRTNPWVAQHNGVPVATVEDQAVAVIVDGGSPMTGAEGPGHGPAPSAGRCARASKTATPAGHRDVPGTTIWAPVRAIGYEVRTR